MLNQKTVDIKRVLEAYSDELGRVEEHLGSMLSHDNALIQSIGRHLMGSGGKRLRPLFLILSARLTGYRGGDDAPLAAIVEIIHSASLLHDDVVDEAEMRRGRPSANSIWGNPSVVLAGDYLYSNALKNALRFGNLRIIDALASAITYMTNGELLQLMKTGDTSITDEEYIRIVSAKTGALFSQACRIGAILGEAPEEQEEALVNYGMKVGIAFQMVDDILDYEADESELGKKLGKDLGEGKITLPLICLLKSATPEDRREIDEIVSGELTDEALERTSRLISKYKAIDEAVDRAEAIVAEAKGLLGIFPRTPERDLLADIADYSLYREK